MASVVTVEQVRRHLSSPPWSSEQEAACGILIAARQTGLARWFGVPIDPVNRIETVQILDSGLLATSWPVFQVYAINGVTVPDPGALLWEPLPDPYAWREEGWVAAPAPESAAAMGYLSRPFSLFGGSAVTSHATVSYAGGWGPQPDIVGALVEKVAAVMLNRHDDTVVARQLDAEAPPPVKEDWTDKELMMLKTRRRARGGHRR